VPKVVGFERISELSNLYPMKGCLLTDRGEKVCGLTNLEHYHEAADFFWDIVTGQRSLAFGGNSRREHFPSKEACTDFINDIPGIEGVALYQRYIERMTWREIAENLTYTESGIFKVRERALQIAERRLNGGETEDN
jgi:hypothetical protein